MEIGCTVAELVAQDPTVPTGRWTAEGVMTKGDFTWQSIEQTRTRSRKRERRDRVGGFVAGDPVPYMDSGEDYWSWTIKRAIGIRLAKPHLEFVIDSYERYGHRFGLHDLAKPVLDAVGGEVRAAWVAETDGPENGVRIGDVAAPFPPRVAIEVILEASATRAEAGALREELEAAKLRIGSGPIGVHLTFGRNVVVGDFGFGGPVRILLDAMSAGLGGDERSSDLPIRDLRVLRESRMRSGTELRIWPIER